MPWLAINGKIHDTTMASRSGKNLIANVSARIVCLCVSVVAFLISTTAVCDVPKFTKIEASTEKDNAKK